MNFRTLDTKRRRLRPFTRQLAIGAAIALVATHPALAKPGDVGEWVFSEIHADGDPPKCDIAGKADASTVISLTTEAKDHPQAYFGVANEHWSIKKDDDVGNIQIFTDDGQYRLSGKYAAIEHGIVTWVDEDDFLYFLQLAKGHFEIRRNGELVGRYSSGNLSEMVAELRRCGTKLSALDPFAKPTPQAPAVAVPPKPVDKDEWLRSIEKAYFAGPLGKCILCIRNMERNSEAAQVKFKMTVDQQGKLINCEILQSSGYADWRDEFCRLTMNSQLKFTPAFSNAGQPMVGEYIDNAVVAFQ